MKRFQLLLARNTKLILSLSAVTTALGLLLFYRLGSLVHGVSPNEAATWHAGVSLAGIYHNPVDLPLKFLQWLCFGIVHTKSIWLLRLPNILLATGAFVSFGVLLRKWYGVRTALFGSVLFAFAPWFLHAARLASADALQLFGVVTLLLIFIRIGDKSEKNWQPFVYGVIASLLVYIAGMAWFVLAALILNQQGVRQSWKHFSNRQQRSLYLISWLAPLALLALAFYKTPSLWRSWLALPTHFVAPLTILGHVGEALLAFVWRGPQEPAMWLDRLPLLNVLTIVMLFVGIAFYGRHWLAPRTRLLLTFFLIGIALYALGGSATLSFAVPIVYTVVAAGVGYLLHEWLTVFPANPLARLIGMVLIGATISLSCLYNVRQYFIAWPHNPTTQETFRRL